MRRWCLPSLLALSSTLVAGCGGDASPAPLARSSAAIIGGVLDDSANDDVVLVQIDLGGGNASNCTGTLIAHEVVLTARHCVTAVGAGYDLGADVAPSTIAVWLGATPLGAPDAYGAKLVHDGATNLHDHDLALVVLDRRIGTQLSPLRLGAPPTRGETVKVVGYGLTQADTTLPSAPHQRYRRDGLSIAELGPGAFQAPIGYDLGSNELAVGESICEGDSGGPLQDEASGALVGVTSRGGNGQPSSPYPFSGCTGSNAMNTFTRVDAFATLIGDTIRSVGEEPWLEGSPEPAAPAGSPMGGACVGIGDCAPHLACIAHDGAGVCSTSCRTAPCPSGFDCTAGFCFAPAGAQADAGVDAPPSAPPPRGCALERRSSSAPSSRAIFGASLVLCFAGLARRRLRA